ncbi:hypothetical protein DRZ78_03130 [Candidatus Aerophobetes bacterium]|uniref:Uncharacterized protein n=1 Tax=Aerophobetes bacterium TaxID=2030807 RepID=A0A662D383_UNCAE|nr:MAG: hypothetical protein DRZ78_03130 [Candidatus Aerophobetes bacterium]
MIQAQQIDTDLYTPIGSSAIFESILPEIPEIYKDRDEESSTFQYPQNCIDYIESIYILKNAKEIRAFLVSNDDLIQILLNAQEHIQKVFGQFPIFLELHHDSEEEWDELFIVIKTNYSPEKAVELENQLFEEWFVEVLSKVSGRLNFTEEPL